VPKVAFPGHRLHEASPTGPESPWWEHLCPGYVVLPEAILRRPGEKEWWFCPKFSTQYRSWGPNKLRATCLRPFLHLRERFETLAAVVNFPSFRAGKFLRRAKQ
jgi:hypothetical protein